MIELLLRNQLQTLGDLRDRFKATTRASVADKLVDHKLSQWLKNFESLSKQISHTQENLFHVAMHITASHVPKHRQSSIKFNENQIRPTSKTNLDQILQTVDVSAKLSIDNYIASMHQLAKKLQSKQTKQKKDQESDALHRSQGSCRAVPPCAAQFRVSHDR